jgi:hypothetical protein
MEKIQNEKPFAGLILSLIAGILILLVGISMFFIPTYIESISESVVMTPEDIEEMEEAMSIMNKIIIPFAIIGLISGILIISGSILGYQGRRTLGGLMVLIPSILYIPAIIGIIGVIGGVLIIWKK